MKLLLDANLSWRLCNLLSQNFPSVLHVNKIPLPQPASDDSIWSYAKENGYCIVTNDEDYLRLLLKNGFPPKLILLRMGNQSTRFVRDTLLKHTADIVLLEKAEDYGLLEIHG